MKLQRILAAVLAGTCFEPPAQAEFTASDLTHWIGTGTNEAVVVVDWNDGREPIAVAWGIRWNGKATGADLMDTIRESDIKFTFRYHPSFPKSVVYAIGYDAGLDRMTLLEGQPGFRTETGFSLDPDDRYREGWFSGFWSFWEGIGNPYVGGRWRKAAAGLSSSVLSNGTWLGWGYDADFSSNLGGLDDAPDEPVAARSEYATTVVEYIPGTGIGLDMVDFAPFDDPVAALGRPTIDTTGEGFLIPETHPTPVVPVGPAFRAFELVSVGNGGKLTLAFDHPVLDEANNPFGIDFIIYGNAFLDIEGGGGWVNGNPSSVTVSGAVQSEPGRVSVSQDGAHWFPFPTPSPLADTFAPTLGRRFAPADPAPLPQMTNLWWGAPTDPTFPLDPSLDAADLAGKRVSDVAAMYGTSAGGTGFDIGALALPRHPVKGVKWFRFVRIERDGLLNPEVDAVADVMPGLPYTLWQISHFSVTDRMDNAIAGGGADPDQDRVRNLFEYLTGGDPKVSHASSPLEPTVAHTTTASVSVLEVRYTIRDDARDTRVLVEYTDDMVSWGTNGIDQVFSAAVTNPGWRTVTARVPAGSGNRSVRLRGDRP